MGAQARGFTRHNDALQQFGAQVFFATGLAAAKHFQQRMVYVLGRHDLYRLALQVVAVFARRYSGQVTGGTGVHRERGLEAIALKGLRMRLLQVLEDAALQRQKHGTKELGV